MRGRKLVLRRGIGASVTGPMRIARPTRHQRCACEAVAIVRAQPIPWDRYRQIKRKFCTIVGGVLSPLLANVALDGMERLFGAEDDQAHYRKPSQRPGRDRGISLIRYADDAVVTAPTRETLSTYVIPKLTTFLAEQGLKLSEAKTRIVHVDEGFDFLGFTVRRYRGVVLTRPQKTKLMRHLRSIADYLRQHRQATASQIIGDLGPMIRGWANYYRHGASKHAFHLADHHVNAKLRRWVKRRHPTKTAAWCRSKYFDAKWNFVDGRTRLARHDEVAVTRHVKVQGKRSPLNPDDRDYWEQRRRRRLAEILQSHRRSTLLPGLFNALYR